MLQVLPGVLRAAEVPLDLGGVMPTWAVMPLLQEPVWDIWASAAAFWPASSYWPWAWEEEEDEEGFQREEPLPGSMLASSSSSTFFRSSAPAQLLLTSCSACLDLLPLWDWKVSNKASEVIERQSGHVNVGVILKAPVGDIRKGTCSSLQDYLWNVFGLRIFLTYWNNSL